ncbi:MAG: plasmid mobilization relaxosome protein MobC [Lachnospiraceae bacterium]|nr:plasmid mobilization relaxosome protein MobC [Lachnospiraceae bacterium]
MARPKTDRTLKRGRKIIARFTETEYEVIRHNAENAGKSLSAYVRDAVTGGKVDVHYHLSPQIAELKPLLAEIGKTGSNLNQIARHLNSGGALTDGIAADIRRCVAELFDLREELSGKDRQSG